jgi:hypothetical protein
MSPIEMLKKVNAMAEFNRWCGIEVTVAEPGFVEIQMPWRPELGQYSGFLHAGLIGTLIDTACGFASRDCGGAELVGRQLFRQLSAACGRPKVHCAGSGDQVRQSAGVHQLRFVCGGCRRRKAGGERSNFADGGRRLTGAARRMTLKLQVLQTARANRPRSRPSPAATWSGHWFR